MVDEEGGVNNARSGMKYFSEREQGERPRSGEDLTGPTGAGIQSEIAKRLNGWLACSACAVKPAGDPVEVVIACVIRWPVRLSLISALPMARACLR